MGWSSKVPCTTHPTNNGITMGQLPEVWILNNGPWDLRSGSPGIAGSPDPWKSTGPWGFGWKNPPDRWSESCSVFSSRWWLMVIFWTCAKQICEDIFEKVWSKIWFRSRFVKHMDQYGTENHALNCDVKRPGCAFQPPKVTAILGGESFWKRSYWLDERWGAGSICGWWTCPPKPTQPPPRNEALFRAYWLSHRIHVWYIYWHVP